MTVAGTGLSSLIREKKRGCKKKCPLSKNHYQIPVTRPGNVQDYQQMTAWLSNKYVGRLNRLTSQKTGAASL